MRKQIALIGVAGLLVLAIGSSPRYIEELRIGGGYGDSADGGADFENDGDIYTNGNAAVGKTLDVAGNVAIGDNATVSNTITLNNVRKPTANTGYEIGSYTALQPAPTGASSAYYYAVMGEILPDIVAAQDYTSPGFLQAGYFYVLPPAPGHTAALGIGMGGGPAYWDSTRTGTFTDFRCVNAEYACGNYGAVNNLYGVYVTDMTNGGSSGGQKRYGVYICGAGGGSSDNKALWVGYGGSYFDSAVQMHSTAQIDGNTTLGGDLTISSSKAIKTTSGDLTLSPASYLTKMVKGRCEGAFAGSTDEFYSRVTSVGTTTGQTYRAVCGQADGATNTGTSSLTGVEGHAVPYFGWSGSIARGMHATTDSGATCTARSGLDIDVLNGGGTTTNLYGARIAKNFYAGAVTNLYGIYMSDLSGATNNYALYTNAGAVRFGDNVSTTGDVVVHGGDIEAGTDGVTRGTITAWEGAGGNAPGYTKLCSPNGTAWYLFVEDDGTLKVHNAPPTSNSDGAVVGLQD